MSHIIHFTADRSNPFNHRYQNSNNWKIKRAVTKIGKGSNAIMYDQLTFRLFSVRKHPKIRKLSLQKAFEITMDSINMFIY
jgi:hypothetical protein